MAETESDPRTTKTPGGSPLRWIVLAALVGVTFWFGLKAFNEIPEAGSGGPPPGGGGGFPPSTVIVATAIQQEVQEYRQVTGTLRAVSRADVAAREAGAVELVSADEGDVVKKGAPLAKMDPRRIDAEIAESQALQTGAKSLVIQREAETKRAASDLQMKTELIEDRAISKRELLDAERAEAVARALEQAARDQLTAAESQMALLKVRQADLSVPAPFDGRVVMRHVDPGEWLNPGEPVVTLVSTGTIEAWLNVPERFAASINGGALKVTIEGLDKTVTATKVRRIADVDIRTRLFPVVAELDDLGGALVPGMSVRAELPVGNAQALVGVPADAVIEAQAQAYVFRAATTPESQEPPVAEKVVVRVAFRRDGLTWLEPGRLEADDQVVVEGNERLFPGTPLLIPEAEPPAAQTADTAKE